MECAFHGLDAKRSYSIGIEYRLDQKYKDIYLKDQR